MSPDQIMCGIGRDLRQHSRAVVLGRFVANLFGRAHATCMSRYMPGQTECGNTTESNAVLNSTVTRGGEMLHRARGMQPTSVPGGHTSTQTKKVTPGCLMSAQRVAPDRGCGRRAGARVTEATPTIAPRGVGAAGVSARGGGGGAVPGGGAHLWRDG